MIEGRSGEKKSALKLSECMRENKHLKKLHDLDNIGSVGEEAEDFRLLSVIYRKLPKAIPI